MNNAKDRVIDFFAFATAEEKEKAFRLVAVEIAKVAPNTFIEVLQRNAIPLLCEEEKITRIKREYGINKITAIKYAREAYKIGLKEAKDLVEKICE